MITTDVVIIGTGFSGMGMAIALQKAGISRFLLLEKAKEVGGTWRENTYPGAECDIPSALYSYSFEHNPAWEFKWSEQPQIFDYLKKTAAKHELYEHIHFGQEVRSASFDEATRSWKVETVQGMQIQSRFLVSAVGQLHRPFVPALPGIENFNGPRFHSARWRHDVNLKGKRVAVVGNAASALQFIPQIAPEVGKLTIFQRSANWVMPKFDRPYKPWEQWLSDKVPFVAKLYRFRLWARNEWLVFPMLTGNRLVQAVFRRIHMKYLNRTVTDPELRKKLIPDYPVGAKRVLFSDDYFEALARDNVDVVTERIERIEQDAIVTQDGTSHLVDVLIFGTGFRTNPFLAPMDIRGMGGKSLREHWREGAQAYYGVCTSHFPNFFMMYGPNTNLGHNSIVIMAEAQARFISECIQRMTGAGALVVKPEAEEAYNRELQRRLRRMVWNSLDASWYKDGGRVTNNWAGTTLEYMRRMKRINWRDFEVR
ncbi:cation diffusion facilitator CzcD-associated flavoprotein CzcO [Litorivivens lipolytica]|uniref:Cation diffusion facilitator CzcD-associated flavoprotein CzcO n=1 Tax=Litorivivens lipolytica TaxID=1524264 RepID=A0A7W4W491_9GAMM|nr:NAD(P)/FAD-dependent oxidoreductase [Litorivivens lipolytica]MBB3047040.1 cation diffusion facilitator CzcD-associated flavoprotein CzcO [Litorivivens lipolytica]